MGNHEAYETYSEHCTNLAVRHLEECYAPEADGVRFLDVFYREPIKPNRIPRSIWDDPYAGPGLESLQRLSQQGRLTLHMVTGFHGSKRNLDETLRQQPMLQSASFIGIEADWLASHNDPRPQDIAILTDAHNPGRREFQESQIDTLRKQGKVILPFEHSQQELTLVRRHILEMWSIYTWATSKTELPETVRNDLRARANLSCQVFRRLAMPGRLGYWMKTLEQTGGLDPGNNDVVFWAGSLHRKTALTLKNNGINVALHKNTKHTLTAANYSELVYGETFMDILHNGYAGNEQLNIPLPY